MDIERNIEKEQSTDLIPEERGSETQMLPSFSVHAASCGSMPIENSKISVLSARVITLDDEGRSRAIYFWIASHKSHTFETICGRWQSESGLERRCFV